MLQMSQNGHIGPAPPPIKGDLMKTKLVLGAAALLSIAGPGVGVALAADQPSQNASCQGQVNGYYNSHYSDGGQQTSSYANEEWYSDAVVLGAQSHDCNVPNGVPAGEPKRNGAKS